MDQTKNPFSPGAGTPPPALVGRQAILEQARVALARIKEGKSEKSLLLVGLRGVGKTVLLRAIEEKAKGMGYISLFIEAPEKKRLPALLLPALREAIFTLDRWSGFNEKVKRALRVLRSFMGTIKVGNESFNVAFAEPELGTADSGDLQADLTALFIAIGEAAAARSIPVALILDEMQYLNEEEFGALISAIHALNQRQLPLILIGAGLPQLVGLAGKAKSYAERLFSYPQIGPLDPKNAEEALKIPVEEQNVMFDPEALAAILDITKGYPYFLQEWGYEIWNFASSSPISLKDVHAVSDIVIKKLDENFFKVRFDRLTPVERNYLRAMAELGPGSHRSGEITERFGISVNKGAPVRNGLIRKGMIYSPAHGDTAFTVPLFDEFMIRSMPLTTF